MANLVETFDDQHTMITGYDYAPNIHSDSEFCKETITSLGKCEKKHALITDGAYGSVENVQLAASNNIELVTTTLTGSLPDEILAEFKLDESTHDVLTCPMGLHPYKAKYNPAAELYKHKPTNVLQILFRELESEK